MRQKLIQTVVADMLSYLNNAQVEKLQEVLLHTLWDYDISPSDGKTKEQEQDLLALFLAAKRIEGCSEKSLKYYQATTQAMLDGIGKPIKEIVTEDIRQYLTNYQRERHSSRVTIDNIRRILSSFFSWLEDEDYILKSPVRRIHKVKTASNIKETYSDETLELMRDSCSEMRDLAMIDLLASTGMRVGEMVLLNRDDVDFAERECVVFGKGDKERMVYFDARTKLHLQAYLDSRSDNNPALIVSLKAPFNRLSIGGVETRLRELGKQLGVHKVHPHKFRRTLATMAIDKGMPIQQHLLQVAQLGLAGVGAVVHHTADAVMDRPDLCHRHRHPPSRDRRAEAGSRSRSGPRQSPSWQARSGRYRGASSASDTPASAPGAEPLLPLRRFPSFGDIPTYSCRISLPFCEWYSSRFYRLAH